MKKNEPMQSQAPLSPRLALRELRRRMGQSQEVFAHKLRYTLSSIAKAESKGPISVTLLVRLHHLAKNKKHDDLAARFAHAILVRLSLFDLAQQLFAAATAKPRRR